MRKTLVLDANLLVLLAVGLADPSFITRHKRLHPTYRKGHFDRLLAFINSAPATVTTTHALTEASNLLRQCADPMRSKIMVALGRVVETTNELSPRASRVIAVPEFIRLGLTDAAFVLLDPKRYALLSVDLDLIIAMARRGFEVVNFGTLVFD